MRHRRWSKDVCCFAAVLLSCSTFPQFARAVVQAPAGAAATTSAAVREIGTVRSVDANSLALTTDKGEQVTVTLSAETRVLQLAPGSTDLKSAQAASVSDLVVGDRVLAVGSPGSGPLALTARRIIVMKSTDIAQRRQAEEAEWQHSAGGIVRSVDAATGVIALASGVRMINVTTTPATVFRRYAAGSARFEDAQRSSIAALKPGDQVRVRGPREGDGAVAAQEVVSGSFEHASGRIASIDAATGRITLRDLKTKKLVTLSVTSGTAIHQLPPEAASRFAAHAKQGHEASPAEATPSAATEAHPREGGSADLSQVVAHLPKEPIGDLKAGDAVMVVGSGSSGSAEISAITILTGVEPILASSPSGSGSELALSPWSVDGGADAGAAAQ